MIFSGWCPVLYSFVMLRLMFCFGFNSDRYFIRVHRHHHRLCFFFFVFCFRFCFSFFFVFPPPFSPFFPFFFVSPPLFSPLFLFFVPQAVRLSYLHFLRSTLTKPLRDYGADGARACVELLEEYGLSRDDLFEVSMIGGPVFFFRFYVFLLFYFIYFFAYDRSW